MPSIKQIQEQLKKFDSAARSASDPAHIQRAWRRLFNQDMSAKAAKGFATYYREMRSKASRRASHKKSRATLRRRKHRGGADLTPAPYPTQQMVPGFPVNTYGSFPVEVDTDPSSIKDLDVYFHDSLPLSPAGYWPTVPANMGSNKVGGGKRSRRGLRKSKRATRRHRGGNLMESIAMRPMPYLATPYPNQIQSADNTWSGNPAPVPTSPSPVDYTWTARSNGTMGIINPGAVSQIDSTFQKLASPAPWQTMN